MNASGNTFFPDFHTDRMAACELYDIMGGIERNDDSDRILVEDISHQDTEYDPLMPNWQERKRCTKKSSNKSRFFSRSSFFGL